MAAQRATLAIVEATEHPEAIVTTIRARFARTVSALSLGVLALWVAWTLSLEGEAREIVGSFLAPLVIGVLLVWLLRTRPSFALDADAFVVTNPLTRARIPLATVTDVSVGFVLRISAGDRRVGVLAVPGGVGMGWEMVRQGQTAVGPNVMGGGRGATIDPRRVDSPANASAQEVARLVERAAPDPEAVVRIGVDPVAVVGVLVAAVAVAVAIVTF